MTRASLAAIATILSLWLLQLTATAAEPSPPILLRYEGRAEAHTPQGAIVPLPAGSEVGACADGNTVLVYNLASRTLRVPRPCTQDDVFRDGFEP